MVEVENTNDKKSLFSSAYRHPNSNIDHITSHLHSILPKLPIVVMSKILTRGI